MLGAPVETSQHSLTRSSDANHYNQSCQLQTSIYCSCRTCHTTAHLTPCNERKTERDNWNWWGSRQTKPVCSSERHMDTYK